MSGNNGEISENSVDWRNFKPSVGEGFSYLSDTGLNSEADVSFKVGPTEVTFNAHKIILMKSSEIFEVQFSKRWAPQKDNPDGDREIINIPDQSPESFNHFLNYFYTEELSKEMEVEEALDVLDLAIYNQVSTLIHKCSDFLKSKIVVDSCVDIYQRTCLYSILDLSALAITFMKKNISLVALSDQFLHLNLEELTNLLKSDDLRINELLLFKALLRWGAVEDGQSKLRKDVMKSLIPSIRFLLISPTDFEKEVVPTQVLSDAEVSEINYYRNGTTKGKKKSKKLEIWSTKRQPKFHEAKCYPLDVECPKNAYNCLGIKPKELTPHFRFRSSSPIMIRGLKIYGISSPEFFKKIKTPFQYKVQFSFSNSKPSKSLILDANSSTDGIWSSVQSISAVEEGNFDVLLETPFQTDVNENYWISALLSTELEGKSNYWKLWGPEVKRAHGVGQHLDELNVSTKSEGNVSFDFDINCYTQYGTSTNHYCTSGKIGLPTGIVHSILFSFI